MPEPIDAHDRRNRRCPMLGHPVPFSYCRAPGRDLPCPRVFDCWWETFEVVAFIRSHFSEAQIAEITQPKPDKAATLVELIERAKRAKESDASEA
jgi:hypothetical protein